jgi:hypothetical protein
MDIAVNLVESYLRLNGYLTVSEVEIQERAPDGTFRAVTDIDVMAVRFPGDVFVGDPHHGPDTRVLALSDPVLQLEDGQIDVIVGEVKQGEATLNPGMRRHASLHGMLRRVEWLFDAPLSDLVDDLARREICIVPARGGGTVRTRLVAFGRAPDSTLHVITHTHIVETMLRFFEGHDEAFRPVQFRDPAPAMLSLLLKTGFTVSKEGGLEQAPGADVGIGEGEEPGGGRQNQDDGADE